MASRLVYNGNHLKIGADPEFMLIRSSGGRPIEISRSWNSRTHGNFSRDSGSHTTGEIRPSPGTPTEVTEHIRAIIREIHRQYPDTRLIAGGGKQYDKYVGGHIHFGINVTGKRDDIAPTHKRVLDRFIGRPLKALPGGARWTKSYGDDGDIRTKSHGFEYRTPPSWLSDPLLTLSMLEIAHRLGTFMVEGGMKKDWNTGRKIVTPGELDALIPRAHGELRDRLELAVARYKDYIYGGFNLATDDAFERWLAPIPYEFRRNHMINIRELGAPTQPAAQAPVPTPQERLIPYHDGIMGRRTPITRPGHVHIFNGNSRASDHQMHLPVPRIRIYTGAYGEVPFVVERAPNSRTRRGMNFRDGVVYVSFELKGMFRKPRGMKVKYVSISDSDHQDPIVWISGADPMNPRDLMATFLARPRRSRRLTTA